MPNTFEVEVVAADRKLFTGRAVSVTVPGVDGYFGVLRLHAPMIAALSVGQVTITRSANEPPIIVAVAGGFAEILPDRVAILTDAAEMAEEIDIERARLARQRAEENLRIGGPEIDTDRAKAALLRAINRLRAAEGPRGI